MNDDRDRLADGPTAGAGPRRDLGGDTAGNDEVTGGGATKLGETQRDARDQTPSHAPETDNLPGDDQGDPA